MEINGDIQLRLKTLDQQDKTKQDKLAAKKPGELPKYLLERKF